MSLNKTNTLSILSWFGQKGYAQGAFWATMICVVSVGNDILMRLLGSGLHAAEVSFFRFLFGMLTVLPIMMRTGKTIFYTKHPFMHFFRGLVGAIAIGACCLSVNLMPLSDNTTIMFSQPLFFLPMAVFFLAERVDISRWLATLIGFLGLIVIVQPGTEAFQIVAFVPIIAAIGFAVLDIIAKKMVATENTYTMMFSFSVVTTVAALGPAIYFWKTPNLKEIFLLCLLGIGGNLIQACVYRAFSATDASALQPFRYVEFIFSAAFGFVFFTEIPKTMTFLGALLIIAGTFYISYAEKEKEKTLAKNAPPPEKPETSHSANVLSNDESPVIVRVAQQN